LSDDHSLVGEMIREGRLTEAEAAVHPHRSILSRALGTEPAVRIDEFEVDLLGGDVVLLCSDGLCGVVPAPVIAKHMGRSDPQEAARRLIDEARKAGGPDNITAVVIRLETPDLAGAGDDEITLVEPPADDEVTQVSAPPAPDVTVPEAGPDDDPYEAVTRPGRAPAVDDTLFVPGGPAAVAEAAAAGAVPPGAGLQPAPDPVPPAPEPGPSEKPRRRRRGLGWFALVLALLVLAGAIGAVTLSTTFYIGNDGGKLAVYSGLPSAVGPLPLHAVYRRSTVEYSSLTPAQRQVVDERALRGRADVLALAAALGMRL
jgi:PPM family protein phosphatase